jgi:hypothetical protein
MDHVMLELHPAYRPVRDENRWQEAAETVAMNHMSRITAEYCEWWREQVDHHQDAAFIVSNLIYGDSHDKAEARRLSVNVQNDFFAFVANASDTSSWKLERDMYREVSGAV